MEEMILKQIAYHLITSGDYFIIVYNVERVPQAIIPIIGSTFLYPFSNRSCLARVYVSESYVRPWNPILLIPHKNPSSNEM